MRRVWGVLLCLSVSAALGFGRWDEAAAAVLAAGNQALSLGMTLIGGMMIWGGLMAILQESGAMGPVSRWMPETVAAAGAPGSQRRKLGRHGHEPGGQTCWDWAMRPRPLAFARRSCWQGRGRMDCVACWCCW